MTFFNGKQTVALILGTLLAYLTGCTISSNTPVDKHNDQPTSNTPVDQTRDKPTSNTKSIEQQLGEQFGKHVENEMETVFPILELAILHFATTGKLATRDDILALAKSEESDIDLAAFSELTCSIENEKFTMRFARADGKGEGKVSIPKKDLLLVTEALREKKRECNHYMTVRYHALVLRKSPNTSPDREGVGC